MAPLTPHAAGRRPAPAIRRAQPLLLCALLLVLLRSPGTASAEQRPGAGEPGTGPAPGPAAPADVPGERSWPVGPRGGVPPPKVVHGWKPPPTPYTAGHRGVDLAAERGSPVRAATTGTVAFAGTVAGRRVLSVDVEGSGTPPLRITYEPVRSEMAKGDRVSVGEQVGVVDVGPFHCAEACLHWGLRRGDVYLDPLALLPGHMRTRPPSRLLPVFGVAEPPPAPARAGTESRPPPLREWILICLLTGGGCWARRRLHRRMPGQARERFRRRRREAAGRRPRDGLSPPHRAGPWPRRPP